MSISVLGIDIGKNSFHLFDSAASNQKAARKKMPRHKLLEYIATLEPRTIAMEACGGAHFLARTFEAHGHTVKLIAPQYRQAVREDQQERLQRCRGDQRGCHASEHALCADQKFRTTVYPAVAPCPQ